MNEQQLLDLPLFPLSGVLFPYVPLDLRIFEQRYLNMITEVLKTDGVFGVVPIIKGWEVGEVPEVFPYGTLVSIRDWNKLPDGLLGITVAGEQCFRVEFSQADKLNLLTASVDLVVEEQQEAELVEAELRELFELLPDHALVRRLRQVEDIGLTRLSWLLAALAALPKEVQLRLLTTADSAERIRIIRGALVNRH